MSDRARLPKLLIVVAVVLCLAGCQLTQRPTGQPIAIRQDGAGIEVAVCVPLQLSGVLMQEREYPGAWETFWEFDKELMLSPGDEFSSSRAAELGVSDGQRPELTANREIAIFLHGIDPSGNGGAFTTFRIGADGLSEHDWLHDDGSQTSQPCQ